MFDDMHKKFDAVDELIEVEIEIKPNLLLIILLYSLLSSFENFCCTIKSSDEFCHLHHQKRCVLRFWKKICKTLGDGIMVFNNRFFY